MKKAVILLMLSLILVSCTSNNANEVVETPVTEDVIVYKTIDPKTANENIDADETILVLDVRTQAEYDSGHIVGAMLLTLDLIEESIEGIYTDKDQVIYVYCRSGNRSEKASKIMNELGYKNVHDLGGITNWPYDTE